MRSGIVLWDRAARGLACVAFLLARPGVADEPTADDCLAGLQSRCSDDATLPCATDADCGPDGTCGLVQTVAGCPSADSPSGSATVAVEQVAKIDPTCPPPYTALNARTGQCELQDGADGTIDGQVVLHATLQLSSFTQLNCKGLKLIPEVTGTVDDRLTTSVNEYVRSKPELAILIKGAYGVKVQNCLVSDVARPFDFDLLVLAAKTPAQFLGDPGAMAKLRNKILSNTVFGRYGGIFVVKSDNTLIADNRVIHAIHAHGRGIGVYRDSDRIEVANNTIIADSIVNQTNFPLVPQGTPLSNNGNSRGIFSAALANGMLSFTYGGELTQVPLTTSMVKGYPDAPVPDTWLGTCRGGLCTRIDDHGQPIRTLSCTDDLDCSLSSQSMTSDYLSEGNQYVGNIIDFASTSEPWFGSPGFRTFGIVDIGSAGSVIRGNIISNASEGIHFGAAGHDGTVLEGQCADGRWCGADAECFPPGVPVIKGACKGLRTPANVNIGATGTLVVGNSVNLSQFGINVARGSQRITLVGNTVTGCDTGIDLRQNGPNDTVVMRNVASGNRFDIGFDEGAPANAIKVSSQARGYGSLVSLNDFNPASRISIATKICNNFQQVYNCVDDTDCNNACLVEAGKVEGKCTRTNKVCKKATENKDCGQGNGVNNGDAVGVCISSWSKFPGELAAGDAGNYWGRTCDPSDSEGFRASDEPDAGGMTDTRSPLLVDPHPYGESVATTPDELLPLTCLPAP